MIVKYSPLDLFGRESREEAETFLKKNVATRE